MRRTALTSLAYFLCLALFMIVGLAPRAASADMTMGGNFWFSWRGDTTTDPFVSGANFAAYPNTNPWRAEFLTEIGPYKVLRFMDWMCTNSSDQVTWSTRKSVTASDQEGPWLDPAASNNVGKGIAIEWLIDLGNRTNKDIWLCIPHKADNTYVTELARLVRSKLNTNLKCYIEYSNEVWNPGFEQNLWSRQQGAALGLAGDEWEKGTRYYGWRSGQIFQIWATEFSGQMGRIVRVLAGQNNNNTWHADRMWEEMTRAGGMADAWAVAPYFGRDINGTAGNAISLMYPSIDAEAANVVFQRNWATAKGIKLMAYEGGQHVYIAGADVVNRNSQMYDVYQYYFNKMNQYFDVFVHYAHAGGFSSGGAWGAKEYINQAESSAHKYRSLKDWAAAHSGTQQVAAPSFSPAPGTYSSTQNVTITTATSGATIRYTTNGTNPTSTTGTVYSSPVSIAATTTLKAIAYKSGMTDSTVTSGTYTISVAGATGNAAAGTATIDTTVEAAWNNATAYNITKTSGTISSTADCSGDFKAMWDSSNLYVLVTVTDDDKRNDSTDPWADDSVEVYIDGNNNKTTTYDSNDRQYVFGWGDTTVREGAGRSTTGVTFSKVDVSATSYRMEIKIPWSTLGVTASSGKNVGVDVHINDDDAGGAREGKKMWSDSTDGAWGNPSLFGTVTLQAGGTPVGPAGYTYVANEGQSYNFGSQVVDVAYGANGSFNYRYGVTGTITFNNATFGDPIPGTAKYGFYKVASGGGTVTLNPTADMASQGDTAGTAVDPPASLYSTLYYKFSLSSVTGASVTNAKLRIYRNDTGAGSITINCLQGSSDSWSEGGTLPGTGSTITSVTNNALGYVEFTVTSFVQSQYTGDKTVTLAVTTSSGSWTRFASREASSNKPQLVVTTN